MVKCGWKGEEIKDGDYYVTVSKKGKVVMVICKDCWFKNDEKLNDHLKKMYGKGS